jgi:hypothetical protein
MSVTWTATRNDIIKHAFWRIGVVPYGEDPDAEQLAIARFELNAITKHLHVSSQPLWNVSEVDITTVLDQVEYAIADANAAFMDDAWLTISSRPLFLDIYDEPTYRRLTDKAVTSGQPSGVYFKRGIEAPSVFVYPKPDDAYALTLQVVRRLVDWSAANVNQAGDSFPQWWIEPLTWKLSANLSHVFRLNLKERLVLEKKADDLIKSVQVDNFSQNDKGDIFFYAD